MALQAKTLVEEWLNKNGYFTIRGIKEKLNEIDFLAVRNNERTNGEARSEVQNECQA